MHETNIIWKYEPAMRMLVQWDNLWNRKSLAASKVETLIIQNCWVFLNQEKLVYHGTPHPASSSSMENE